MALALWRLSSLLAKEPIMAWARDPAGVIHDDDGRPTGWTNVFAQGLQCVWCVSIWLSPVILGLYLLSPWFAVLLAMSAAAVIIQSVIAFANG